MMIGLRCRCSSRVVQYGRIVQVSGDGMVKIPCIELQNAASVVVVLQGSDGAEG